MKLQLSQLDAHLNQDLAPIYLLSGDEPLQMGEAADAIRQQARKQGFSEREVFHVEANFDWSLLYEASHSLSLFAERRLIELRCKSLKLGDQGRKALLDYVQSPSPDNTLLLIAPKLEKSSQNSKWFKTLEQASVMIQVWPVEYGELPAWIRRRAKIRGLQLSAAAAQLLADRVEGNLLAASQEIDKLSLLYPNAQLEVETIVEVVADSAQYDVFLLVDCALLGDKARLVRMLDGLRAAGAAPAMVLWALANEIRNLAQMSLRRAQGMPNERLFQQYRVWMKRKPAVSAGLERLKPGQWLSLLRRAGYVDRVIKGQEAGNEWDELLTLSLAMAGSELLRVDR